MKSNVGVTRAGTGSSRFVLTLAEESYPEGTNDEFAGGGSTAISSGFLGAGAS